MRAGALTVCLVALLVIGCGSHAPKVSQTDQAAVPPVPTDGTSVQASNTSTIVLTPFSRVSCIAVDSAGAVTLCKP